VGEAALCAITRCVYTEAQPALASYLGPTQITVGVPGGLSIMVHGVRLLLEQNPHFVAVKVDLRNGYNECDRATALRRLAAVPELAYLAPFFHAMHAGASRLQLDDGSALFEGVEGRVGDSSTGVRQGSAESAPVFCVAIHPEVSELHATLSSVGGCASADMDDV